MSLRPVRPVAMTAISLLVAFALAGCAAADPAVPPSSAALVRIARSAEHRITSAAVGDGFVLQVRLPESYGNGAASYPVLYVLDTDIWFGLAADIADNLPALKETAEVIVVGIAYGGTIDDWWQKRARDYLPACRRTRIPPEIPLAGGAARFQEFLAAELFPFIEGRYRAQADNRTLVGFSHGGLFALHTLFTRPELIQRYAIIAPSLGWDDEQIFETEESFHARSTKLPAMVFITWGDRDGDAAVQARWSRFARRVEHRRYEGLRWGSHVFPEETHLSVFPGAFTRSLKFLCPPAP